MGHGLLLSLGESLCFMSFWLEDIYDAALCQINRDNKLPCAQEGGGLGGKFTLHFAHLIPLAPASRWEVGNA